jgi:hypothetical protein
MSREMGLPREYCPAAALPQVAGNGWRVLDKKASKKV